MMRILLVYISMLIMGISCTSEGVLVKNGKSAYKIFISEDASAAEKYAAEELQKYLQLVSGAGLEIVHQPEESVPMIYLGFKGLPAHIAEGLNPATFGNEEYIIRSDGKNLLIAGGESRGTLYGVVGYLTDYLGCRWYTADMTKIPALATIPLPLIEDRQKPAFEYREPYWKEARDTAWVVHNRTNGFAVSENLGGSYISYPFVHTFYQLVSPEIYFQSHPEYFSEVNGKRVGQDAQLCLTHPEVVRIATATVFDWIETHPEANVFSVDQNDGLGYCECDQCRALDESEGSHAGTVLQFVNQIAEAVAEKYPDIKLQTLAYAYTDVPPRTIRPAENVLIRLCHYDYCAVHPVDVCDRNRPYHEQLQAWKEMAPGRLTIWDYYTDFRNYLLPFPNFESISKDLKYYADNEVIGLFAQGNGHTVGEFGALRSWVMAQLMWNPDLDAGLLIEEFTDEVYGPAAGYVRDYIQLLHEQITPDFRLGIYAEPYEADYLNRETIEKADSLFVLAREAVAGDLDLSERVELAHLPVLWFKLYNFSTGGAYFIRNEEAEDRLSEFLAILDQHKIKRLTEIPLKDGTLEDFAEKIQKAGKMEFYTDWWVAGPFDDQAGDGLSKSFQPEKGFDSDDSFIGQNGKSVGWQKYEDHSSGYVDFNQIFGYSEFVLGYAWREIELSEDQSVRFGVGNNDGIRIWMNGKEVFQRKEAAVGPNQNQFTAELKKGKNTVLVKLDQLRHGWGFYLTRLQE